MLLLSFWLHHLSTSDFRIEYPSRFQQDSFYGRYCKQHPPACLPSDGAAGEIRVHGSAKLNKLEGMELSTWPYPGQAHNLCPKACVDAGPRLQVHFRIITVKGHTRSDPNSTQHKLNLD